VKISKSIVSLLLLLAVSLSCKLVDRFRSGGVVSGDYSKVASNLPRYDSKDPAPSPGALALRELAELEPGVSKLVGDVEAAERAALKTGLAQLQAQQGAVSDNEQLFGGTRVKGPNGSTVLNAKSPMVGAAFPAFFIYQGRVDSAIGGAQSAALIGGLVTGLNDIFAPHLEVGANLSKSATETEGGASTTMNVEIGRANDGSTKLGLGFKTEVTKDGLAANSELASKIDGQRCPNAEGQLPFTIKVTLGAGSGGSTYSRDVTAMVRALVNDDAKVEGYTMDLTQATRQVKNGVAVYVETATTMKYDGGNYSESNFRVIRHSQSATAANAEPLSIAGLEAAFATGLTALRIAEDSWLKGGCTKIEAPSPGAVAPRSSTAIPVTVRHRFDGSEVPSKLDAVLSGETSVDPTTLARTKGTLTYVAPSETGKSATIKLTATSRRGRATLDLTASTGSASYRVSGQSNKVSFTGEICSLNKPFVLDATFPGGSAKTSFTPSSVTGGSTSVSGGGNGCSHSGGGSYTVTLKEDGSGTITWTTTDTITCPLFANSRTATFTLPLQPAPDLSCP
jgi:hypothetical protein